MDQWKCVACAKLPQNSKSCNYSNLKWKDSDVRCLKGKDGSRQMGRFTPLTMQNMTGVKQSKDATSSLSEGVDIVVLENNTDKQSDGGKRDVLTVSDDDNFLEGENAFRRHDNSQMDTQWFSQLKGKNFDWDLLQRKVRDLSSYLGLQYVVCNVKLPTMTFVPKCEWITSVDNLFKEGLSQIPPSVLTGLEPSTTPAYGNCLCNAASHLIYGNFYHNVEIRMCILFEGIDNEPIYLDAEELKRESMKMLQRTILLNAMQVTLTDTIQMTLRKLTDLSSSNTVWMVHTQEFGRFTT